MSERVPDWSPEPTFFTATLKLPELFRVTGPITCVAVLVVSTPLGIVHGLQAVPVIKISTVAGSKLLPLIVRLNCCPATGGFGFGLRLLIDGVAPLTVTDSVPDCNPEPTFSIETLKLPELFRVTGPVTCVAVLVVSTPLGIAHGLQAVPVIKISTVDGSKLLPLIVRLNCCPATGGFGFGLRLLIDGVVAPTASDSVPDCNPEPTFSIEMLKLPELFRVTGPVTWVAVLVVSTPLGIVHGLQAVPVIKISTVAGSKLLPLMVRLNC